MTRKLLFILLIVCLLLPVVALPVLGAQDQQSMSWALLTYTYDPDAEGQTPQSGKISYRDGGRSYLHRYSTISWDHENAILTLDGTLCEGESVYIKEAGIYELTVTSTATGDSLTYQIVMLPVIKVGEQYFDFDEKTEKFYADPFLCFPAIECENVADMLLDEGRDIAIKDFQSGMQVTHFGSHVLKLSGNGKEWRAEFEVSACSVQTLYNEEAGESGMLISVGDFPGALTVLLDGATPIGEGGQVWLTKMGQHVLDVELDGKKLEASALPSEKELCLQMAILLPSSEIKEPFILNFSRWGATFYVDGELIEGDYRIASAGEHVFVAKDENGNVIENAFLVKMDRMDAGTSYTEMTITFNNRHHLYALLLAVPALALIAAAVYFFLQRRRIV